MITAKEAYKIAKPKSELNLISIEKQIINACGLGETDLHLPYSISELAGYRLEELGYVLIISDVDTVIYWAYK